MSSTESHSVSHSYSPIEFTQSLTEAEASIILNWRPEKAASLAFRDSLVLHLLLCLGLRRCEIIRLRVSDFVPHGQVCWAHVHGKGDRWRWIPVPHWLFLRLSAHWLSQRFEGIGQNVRAHISDISPDRAALSVFRFSWLPNLRFLSRSSINHIVRVRSIELLGWSVNPHLLRHTAATLWVRKNTDIRTVQQLLGHSNLATTSRYLHTTAEQMVDAVNLFTPFTQLPISFQIKEASQ